ncbi:MAG: BatA domain-containing protein, partial [Verrucomicrobiota bacterium]
MSFLFPLYLLGAAAIAVPILLHLRKRPPKEHIPFSSHLFLKSTPERLTRRTRLERWLLLALRCLAVLLLALAFGRPFFRSMAGLDTDASRTRSVILVDRSASMQRESLWEEATKAAESAISRYDDSDEVAVAFFDDSLRWGASFAEWSNLSPRARASEWNRIAKEENGAGWRASDLGSAMTSAAESLLAADTDQVVGHRELVVISDFQQGAETSVLQSAPWPEEILVEPISLAVENEGNLSVNLAMTPARSNVEEEEVYRVRIRNAQDSDEASVRLLWKGFEETETETTIAPGTSRILTS